ncbi:MAG: ABC transporter ATP-binding protein [Pseudomonadales bacterium]
MVEAVVTVERLETTFHTKAGPVRAVDGVSYSIGRGETLGIVGESGCGKSVTAFSLMRLIESPGEITGGEVRFNGIDLLALSEAEMQEYRGSKIAMIFQEPMTALNPVLTIGYQMDEQIMRHMKLPKRASRERAVEMLSLVGIPAPSDRYENYPHQLSGGMRQRAMIAMALSCDPEFLIADEPTTALDVTIQGQILELIQSLQERFAMTVQFITHDLGVISEISDRVLVMYAGKTCEIAPTSTLMSEPRHPYTAALIGSIPRFGQRVARLPAIEGTVPSLLELPPGCPFQNRCPNAISECREVHPRLAEISRNPGVSHQVACFNPVEP